MLLQRFHRIASYGRSLYRVAACRTIQSALKRSNVRAVDRLWITSPFLTMGMWGLTRNKEEDDKLVARQVLIAKADALFDQGDYKSIYDLLSSYEDSEDVEILWRLCRAMYRMSETASDAEARKLIFRGYDLLRVALDIQEANYAVHKWMSLFLNSKSSMEGTKAHLKELYNVKKHMLRASELNPSDATTLYMLGCWCYEISSLAWYQRKIASAIFAEPPTSTYEEALTYHKNAEEVEPNFYSRNFVMLGKIYLKLNRTEEAIEYLRKAVEYHAKNDDDQKAKQEAQKILNDISG